MDVYEEEQRLIDGLLAEPDHVEPCLVYEDWLEERDGPRSECLKLLRALAGLTPDHASWRILEERIGGLRRSMDPEWLSTMIDALVPPLGGCDCRVDSEWVSVGLHRNIQDTTCDAWKMMVDLVEDAKQHVTFRFSPLGSIPPDERAALVTLPPSVGDLENLEGIDLYGSALVRIPPEIGRLKTLVEFTPYTSYGLHWFPYEITRCTYLRRSTVSTRALFGNFKFNPPFPRLAPPTIPSGIEPATRPCSVCDESFVDLGEHRAWISLRVATDVLPLLVNACSQTCIDTLPPSAVDLIT